MPPFSMAQAIENEGTGKSHFPVPFQKRPREGRFWMLTSQAHPRSVSPGRERSNGHQSRYVRSILKTPYRDGTTHVILGPMQFLTHIHVRHPSGDRRWCKSAFLPICHRQAGRLGIQTEVQPYPVPWHFCSQQQTSRIGNTGEKGERAASSPSTID